MKDINKFFKYIVFSIFPFLLDFNIYNFLIYFYNVNIYISYVIAFFSGTLLAFILTPFIFGNNLNFKKLFIKFLFIDIFVNFLGELFLLYVFFSILKFNYFIARIFSLGIIFLLSFYFKNKLLSIK